MSELLIVAKILSVPFIIACVVHYDKFIAKIEQIKEKRLQNMIGSNERELKRIEEMLKCDTHLVMQ